MLRQDTFWEDEKQCAILVPNHGYLQTFADTNYQYLFDLVDKWCESCGVTQEHIDKESAAWDKHLEEWDGVFQRIHVRDAERVFASPDNQLRLQHILTLMTLRHGDYHQAMSLCAGVFMLSAEVPVVIALLEKITSSDKYLKNFWKAESIACATDGYVFTHLMGIHFPEVHQHFSQMGMLPETYVQKWYNALAIHVLPFEGLYIFLTQFFEIGFKFLFQFSLSLIDSTKQLLLQSNGAHEVFAILRLDMGDSQVTTETTLAIVDPANISKIQLDDIDFQSLRLQMFNTHLKERLERANAAAEEDNESVDYEECQQCHEADGEYWCLICNVPLCDECPPQGEHDEDHPVVDFPDKDDEWVRELIDEYHENN